MHSNRRSDSTTINIKPHSLYPNLSTLQSNLTASRSSQLLRLFLPFNSRVRNVAISSLFCFPLLLPSDTTAAVPLPSSVHFNGPVGNPEWGGTHVNNCCRSASSWIGIPCEYSKSPPKRRGMFSMSTYACSVGNTALLGTISSFATVPGSIHRLTQAKIVGK